MKLCSNCKNYRLSKEGEFCIRLFKENPVNGRLEGESLSCEVERENALRLEETRCGIKAKFYNEADYDYCYY